MLGAAGPVVVPFLWGAVPDKTDVKAIRCRPSADEGADRSSSGRGGHEGNRPDAPALPQAIRSRGGIANRLGAWCGRRAHESGRLARRSRQAQALGEFTGGQVSGEEPRKCVALPVR